MLDDLGLPVVGTGLRLASIGKAYQKCRPEPVEPVSLYLPDVPDAQIIRYKSLKPPESPVYKLAFALYNR